MEGVPGPGLSDMELKPRQEDYKMKSVRESECGVGGTGIRSMAKTTELTPGGFVCENVHHSRLPETPETHILDTDAVYYH